jgi:hypothetical protein
VWVYVSELRPPTGPLSTAQVIYEHGEPRWSDIDRGKLLILSPDLSGNLISSHVVAKQKELVNEMMTLALRILFVYTSNGSLTRHENFIAFKNLSSSAGFEPANIGSKGNNNNR